MLTVIGVICVCATAQDGSGEVGFAEFMAAARGGSSGSGGSNKIIMLQAVKSDTGNMALAVSMERRKLLLRAIVDTAQMVSL
jgi:hypothetical protein